MQLRVDLRRTGDDRHRIALRAIEARALDGDRPLGYIKRLQLTAGIKHRFTCGEGHIRRVDKSAAVTGDTVGIRHDDVRRLAGHFGIALQI